MQPESFLLTVAQIGIALAGFSALISAFRRTDIELTATEIAGRSLILEMGLGATFFALLPFPVDAILDLMNTSGVWRVSSLLLLVFLLGWTLFNLQRFLGIGRQDGQNALGIGFELLLLATALFLALNVIFYGSVSFYMIGLLWMLAVAGIQFLTFVYVYARRSNE